MLKKMIVILVITVALSFSAIAQPPDVEVHLVVNNPAPVTDTTTDGVVEDTIDEDIVVAALNEEELRDPFWPIGFSPKREQEEQVAIQEQEDLPPEADPEMWKAMQKKLKFGGIAVVGSKKVATINNKLVDAGDIVSVKYEGLVFRWKIREITDSRRIRFERLDVLREE